MDPFSHLLWTYLLFRQQWLPALFFGLLPDLCFAAVILFIGFKKNLFGKKVDWKTNLLVLRKALFGYRVGHSFVVAAFFLLAFSLAFKTFFVPALAWFLHIALDLFTHKGSPVEPRRPLWPLCFDVKGLLWWREPWFTALNYGMLALAFFFLR